jgi:Diaminopimelate decarboxylase
VLREVLGMGIKINFDDIGQFEYVRDIRPGTVSFRINPGMGGGEFPGIVTGGHETKFGIPEDYAYKRIQHLPRNQERGNSVYTCMVDLIILKRSILKR